MKSATRSLLRLAALLSLITALGQARTVTAPTAPVMMRDAVADAQLLAKNYDGARVMRIAGTSMLPYFGEGTVVVVKPIDSAKLRAGMLVAYRNRFGETIAHRLVSRETTGWVAQGYNNQQADSTLVTSENLIGVVYATFHTMGNNATQIATSTTPVEVALAAPAK
ncbi:MAG: signal peptidase I [Opitutae bacterium]|nr:signal peptidase I [Opitutae bacterium]